LGETERKDVVSLVRDRYSRGCKNHWGYFIEAEQAGLYFKGQQWARYYNGRYVQPKRKKWKVQLTINKLPTIVESIMATMLSVEPIIQTVPASDQDEDRKASRLTKKALRAYWQKADMEIKLPDAIRYILIHGNCWLRPRWDPRAGPKVEIYKTEIDEETGEEIETDEVEEERALGDLVVDVLPYSSVVIEPGASEFSDAAWVIVVQSLRRHEVEKRFDVELDEQDLVGPDDLEKPVYSPKSLTGEEVDNRERVDLYQMYERPTKKFPDGRLVYSTYNRKLAVETLPDGEIEICHMQSIKLVDELLGSSPVIQSVPLQAEYNRQRSDMVENRRLMGRPKILAPEGCIRAGSWTTRPGEIVPYDPVIAQGHDPIVVKPVANSQSDFSELQLTNEEINDVTSRHEVSQGETSSSVKSGKHGELLLGSDNKRFLPTMIMVEHALKDLGKYMVKILRRNLEDERLMTITGRTHDTETVAFRGADLDEECDIKFEIVSQMPWDQEAMRQQALVLYKQGLIDAAELKARLRQPLVDELHETEQTERINARAENDILAEAYFQPVGTEKHEVHIEEHRNWINRPEQWKRIIEARAAGGEYPPDVMNVLRHMEDHRKAIPQPAEDIRKSLSIRGEIPPQQAMEEVGAALPGRQQADAPAQQPVDEKMGSPEGGMSGEMYERGQPGPSVGE
jgi:hypothetical protein